VRAKLETGRKKKKKESFIKTLENKPDWGEKTNLIEPPVPKLMIFG